MRAKNLSFFFNVFSTLITFTLCGQQLTIKSGSFGFFDNREYFNYYENDQTIFGIRAFTAADISLNANSDFAIGYDGMYEFGNRLNDKYAKPIAYIHHSKEAVNVYLGSFYRYPIIDMPRVLLNDTLQYFKPNIEGIYLAYNKTNFQHNIWIDWISRQSEVNKEIFYIGGSGTYKIKHFYYKHDFIFTHYALTSKVNTGEHIRDNGGIYSRIGYNSQVASIFDTISISSGIVISYDRNRTITPLTFHKGLITELHLAYKSVGLKYTNYIGEGQDIITGDPIYKAKFYNRLDLIWRIFNQPGIKGEVEFTIHLINDFIDYSQKFTLRADFDYKKELNPARY
jgi:hypothetical protein